MKKFNLIILIVFSVICLVGCSKETVSIIPHTVTFNTNGGTTIESKTVYKLEEAPLPRKDNYLFDGWYLDPQYQNLVVFPYEVNNDVTFYAKWVKIKDYIQCKKGSIKFFDKNYNSTLSYSITPNQFDYDRLAQLGYKGMTILIDYVVYYQKDYDVPFDIGYAGSPKYEIYILNSKLSYFEEKNLTTTTKSKHISYSYNIAFINLKDITYTLTFSTDNIQNIIYFDNIVVSYTVFKN